MQIFVTGRHLSFLFFAKYNFGYVTTGFRKNQCFPPQELLRQIKTDVHDLYQ